MELTLSEEQSELAATVRSLLEKRSDSRAVRAAIEAEHGFDADLWSMLCEQIGVAALGVPEEHDGVGAGLVEYAVVLEELGRALTPGPLLSTVVAVEVMLAAADDEARARLLPRLAAGEGIAFVGPVDGVATGVLDAEAASVLLVVDGDDLLEVDPATAEITWSPSMDQTLRLATVRVDTAAEGVTRIGDGVAAAARARLVGALGSACLAVGCADRALAMTVGYSKERVQFGRPIGSFQALKHRMADMLVRVEMARSAAWASAAGLAIGTPDAEVLVHCAASYAAEAVADVTAETVQMHGGIAITWEHDAHLLFKRAHALGQLFGSALEHRRAVPLP